MDDPNMEVDDELFGDIPIPTTSVKGLSQRVDDLLRSGCQQKIAWSKSGVIAYVSDEGMKLNLKHLVCLSSDRKWTVSKDYPVEHPAFEIRSPITHLEWSQNTTDLAVVDTAGRICIVTVPWMAINTSNIVRPFATDEGDDLADVVGLAWVTVDRNAASKNSPPIPHISFAAKEMNSWKWVMTKRKQLYHPRALLCVTKSSLLRLLYHRIDRWGTAVIELRPVPSSNFIVTHAAIASTADNRVLVALQTADRKLYVFRVQIEGLPLRPDTQGDHAAQPTLSVELIDGGVPSGPSSEVGENANHLLPLGLSHLEIIATPDTEDTPKSTPMILAAYTPSIDLAPISGQLNGPQTVIVRWAIQEADRTPHHSFNDIGAKSKPKALSPHTVLSCLGSTALHHAVSSINQISDAETNLAIAFGDGSIHFYSPQTMVELGTERDLNRVSSLPQAGFAYPVSSS
ncbi:MAG: hypothetical protein Q9227_000808, partial [Pyrenula ochraceoflavens]